MEKNASVVKEANRLYWQTELSVADIAEKLSVSRRALYELVAPEHTGASCTECGGDLVFTNRSAKAANSARCNDCGAESAPERAPLEAVTGSLPPEPRAWSRAVQLGGMAIAGAALGALAVTLIARRR